MFSRSILRALAAFAIVCGILVLIVADDSAERAEDPGPSRTADALRATQAAQRALGDENYGAADAHLREVQRELTEMLAEE